MTFKYFYGDQDVLRKNIKRNLGVPYKEYDGNIYSIRYSNRPVFIAHMDVVDVCNMSTQLQFKHGKMFRLDSGLGADDRAGITLIMKHHKDINFIFTRDEEIGRKGATSLALNKGFQKALEKTTAIVQLDCTGHKVVRGALHGYCQDDLMDDIKKVIPDIADSHGSFSDLDSFIDKKAGVNLSVGYYNQHSKNETLLIKELEFVDSILLKLNDTLTNTYKLPVRKVYKVNNFYNHKATKSLFKKEYPKYDYITQKYFRSEEERTKYYGTILGKPQELDLGLDDGTDDLYDYLDESDDMICDNCNEDKNTLIFVDTLEMFMCQECIDNLLDDLLFLEEKKHDKRYTNSSHNSKSNSIKPISGGLLKKAGGAKTSKPVKNHTT